MDGAGIIDAAIEHILNIGDASQILDTILRARCLLYLQKRGKRFWRWKPWQWRIREADIEFDVDGFGDVPLDFGTMGKNGLLLNARLHYELTWLPPRRLFRLRSFETGTSLRMTYYTLATQDAMAGTQFFFVHKRPPAGSSVAERTLHVIYDAKTPTIIDDTTASGLEFFPDEYHETVLLTGLEADLYREQGDGRYQERESEYLQAMREAWRDEKDDRHAARRSPRYGRGRRSVWA